MKKRSLRLRIQAEPHHSSSQGSNFDSESAPTGVPARSGLPVSIADNVATTIADACDKNREQESFMVSTPAESEIVPARVKGEICEFFVTFPEVEVGFSDPRRAGNGPWLCSVAFATICHSLPLEGLENAKFVRQKALCDWSPFAAPALRKPCAARKS
jgi:hypothetical protein